MNSYYTDDLAQRLVVLWVMALMVLYSNNAASADEDIWAMRTAVGAYMVARFTVACAFIVTSFASYHHRVQARIMAGFMFVGLIIIVPLLVDEDRVSLRAKCGVIAAALVYQEATWALTLSPWLKRRLRLTYSTAVDLAHEVDRLAAFFIIILGEFVLTIVLHNPAGTGISLGYLKAFCTLVVAFSLNWVYASGDGGGARSTHPIRHSAWTAFAFFLLHLPMSAAFLIGGHVAAISTELDEFEPGHRWLLGGGLGVGMFCMWVYGMIFHGGPADAVLFMPQYLRVGARLVIAIVLIVMPLSHNHLGTTEFMIVVMCLFAFLLVWETVAGLSKSARVFEPWTHCHPPPDDAPSSHDEEARSD